ncbi:MAG: hypothetical protein IJ760_07620 [Bacteroidales bacterium]|nr:hypothetical protein [Bacteroidales bacterium]
MAKIDYKKLRNELYKRTERYAESVRILYDQALADLAKEFSNVEYDPNGVFSFDEVGKFGRADAIMRRLESQIQQVIEKGVVSEFGEAYRGCGELVRQVIGERLGGNVEDAFMPRVASGNAAKAFIRANRAGSITASQRVWNGAVLGQMETAVEEGLMDGVGAKRMASLLEDYLVNPDECFRRFRVKKGVDANGKSMYGRKWKKRVSHNDGSTTWKDADPRNYPSGQGVYHSSYKNALRYARTTTNIAYRNAEHDRYQEFPFVIAIDIHISNNPGHVRDICDDLQGRYPKDFPWNGWHPNCMCYQVPVLASKPEVDEMVDAILDGEDPNNVEVEGVVEELPDNFVRWAKANRERMAAAEERGTLPYFIRDYKDEVDRVIRKHLPKLLTPDEQWEAVNERFAVGGRVLYTKSPDIKQMFLDNPLSKFGVLEFDEAFESILTEYGDKVKERAITVYDRCVTLDYRSVKGIRMGRTFGRLKNGEVRVEHDEFIIPDEMQNHGISKAVFCHLYDGYKKAGVDIIQVCANITNGAYTWARYGFTFRHGQKYLTTFIVSAGEVNKVNVTEALSIVEKWYKSNSPKDPFPMNLLTGYDWSRDLFHKTTWEGVLRTDDVIQMQAFEDYLGI